MRIAVFGSDSFIGRHLVKHFNYQAIPISHKDLDLTDSDAVEAYLSKHPEIDSVVLCATVGGRRLEDDPVDTVEQNLRMFINLSRFSHRFKKFIWFSSGADPKTRYGFSKYILERLSVLEHNTVCLRIFGCFGIDEPPTRFLTTCIREGEVTIHEDRYFDFFHVKDVCRVVEQCLIKQKLPPRIDLVYKEKYKLSQFAEMLGVPCTVHGESKTEYTGVRGQLDRFNLEFEPMSSLLQKFQEDYKHSLHHPESSHDEPQAENHPA